MPVPDADRLERLLTELMVDPELRKAFKRAPQVVLKRFELEDVQVPEGPVEALQPLDKRLSPSGISGVVISMAAEGLALGHHVEHGSSMGLDPDHVRIVKRAETQAIKRVTMSLHVAPHSAPDRAVPFEREIERAAAKYKLDPALLKGLIKQESNFDPNARSGAGAVGLAQLMPGTAQGLGVDDPTDPEQSIDGGAKYLREMMDLFDGDKRLALAAYNAGPGAVSKFGGVPPYAETQEYVDRVLANAKEFDSHAGPGPGHVEASSKPDRRTGILYLGAEKQSEHQVPPNPDPHEGTVAALKAEAEKIDDAHVRYEWGGGHAGKEDPGDPVTPLDCSGAVSRVLGIDPRVSGGFADWGEAGPGKRVSVYYNAEHVFMVIDGHFFGTSRSNPGGGAGWIPRELMSPAYLARFEVRHPPGM
ncbi:lytic transglycosylase domain-containing protein [Solirubrobacter soli]|uniref:lytic transglycosylase domain-containing protein n=1 Tax=Solirubrobacter soli TaxID=363832 RepID=UPI0004270499|nr:lytic transglycosylase domain-containing protein [Solirubrobacter soli]